MTEELHEFRLRCHGDCNGLTPHHVLGVRGKRHPRSNQDGVTECLECGHVNRDASLTVHRGDPQPCETCELDRWHVRQSRITGVRKGFIQRAKSYHCTHCGTKP